MNFQSPPKAQQKLAERESAPAAATAPEAETEQGAGSGDASSPGESGARDAPSSSDTGGAAASTAVAPFALCCFCGRDLVSRQRAYRKVEGFERLRRAGGTNAVRLRTPTEEWACEPCVDLRAAGREGQESLV